MPSYLNKLRVMSVITGFKSQKSLAQCLSMRLVTEYIRTVYLSLYTNIMISLMRIKSPA